VLSIGLWGGLGRRRQPMQAALDDDQVEIHEERDIALLGWPTR
jgi:hypothetical protein